MLDQNLEDELIKNEIERIELFFLKNNYDKKQKLLFINSKLYNARINNDELLTKVCNKLFENVNK